MYCHVNSDDDQRKLVEILVFDILSIKLIYVSENTLYHKITRPNKYLKYVSTKTVDKTAVKLYYGCLVELKVPITFLKHISPRVSL